MHPRMIKIRTKLTLILVILSLIPFVIIGAISTNVAHAALSEQVFAQLESIRDSKKAQVERYLRKVKSDIAVLANSPHILAALDAFSSALFEGAIDQAQYDYFDFNDGGTQ